MWRNIAFGIAVCALILNMTIASPPVPVSSSYSFKTLVMNGNIELLVVKVLWDQDIYLNGMSVSNPNMTLPTTIQDQNNNDGCNNGGGGGGGPNFPRISGWLSGVSMKVGNAQGVWNWSSAAAVRGEMPDYILGGWYTQDAGATFLGSIGGFVAPEFNNSKGMSFVKLIGANNKDTNAFEWFNNATRENIRNSGPIVMQFSASSVTNIAGESVSAVPIIIGPETVAACDVPGINSFSQSYKYTRDVAQLLLKDPSLADKFDFIASSLDSRDVLQSCKQLMQPMFTTKMQTQTIKGTTQCYYNQGSPQFASSPCCNNTLRNSQCCSPQDTVMQRSVLNNISTSAISNMCYTPDKVVSLILTYIDEQQKASANDLPDERVLSDSWSKFNDKCQTIVYSSKCTIDLDCKYSGSCDPTSGTCKVPTGTDYHLSAMCFYDEMFPDMRDSLATVFGLTSSAADKPAFIARLESDLSYDDCLVNGPQQKGARQCTNSMNGCTTCVAGNRTLCEQDKQCNWNNMIGTQARCLDMSGVDTSPNFCGQCWNGGSNCWVVTQNSLCILDRYQSANACTNITGYNTTWYNPNTNCPNCGQCVDINKKTKAQCVPAAICPPGDDRCSAWQGGHMCFAPSLNKSACDAASSQQSMNNGNWNWNQLRLTWNPSFANGTGLCMASQFDYNSILDPTICGKLNSTVGGAPVQFYPGLRWSSGVMENQQQCEAGVCNWRDPLYQIDSNKLTAQDCTSRMRCTLPCPRCSSRNPSQINGNCFATNVTSSDCTTYGGQWQWKDPSDTSTDLYRCSLNAGSATECTGKGLSIGVAILWRSCGALTSRDTCNAGYQNVSNYMQCGWDDNAPCRTQSECLAAGQCDDWDRQSWGNSFGSNVDGACIIDAPIDSNGWPSIDPNQLSKVNGSTEKMGWSRIPGKATDQGAKSPGQCATIGGTWVKKAYNSVDCLAATACLPDGQNWPNLMSPSECSKCNGAQTSIYKWTWGSWEPAAMTPYTWKAKQWSSSATWGKKLDMMKMYSKMVQPAIQSFKASKQFSMITSKYGQVANLFYQLSCDCNKGKGPKAGNCFNVTAVIQGISMIQPGQKGKLTTPTGMTIVLNNGTARAQANMRRLLAADGAITITMGAVTALSLANVIGSVPNYQVVQASSSVSTVIGALAGDGSQISGISGAASASVTLNLNSAITPNSTFYPTGAIGQLIGNSKVVIVPGITVVVSSGSIQTDNITADGTYFPIFVQSNWAAVTMSPTSSAAGTTSAGPTVAPNGVDSTTAAAATTTGAQATTAAAPPTFTTNGPVSAARFGAQLSLITTLMSIAVSFAGLNELL